MPLSGLRTPLAALAALAAMLLVPAASAGEQAERAIEAVRRLAASGELPPGSSLRLGFKEGNVDAFLGRDLALQRQWESRTGVVLDAHIVPQQPARTTLLSGGRLDVVVARNHEYPDLLADGLIADLTPLFEEFGFRLDDDPRSGFIRPELQAWHAGRIAAVPADGDIVLLHLRRDLLEDPREQAAFRKAYGRPLVAPRTWREYEALQRFFHRPTRGLYGSAEERDADGAWMFWLPRYLSMAAAGHDLFDDRMRPLIDSPAGVAATESYVATARLSAPDSTEPGKGYNFTMPLFAQGKAFSLLQTVAAARILNDEGSAVRGRVLTMAIPGALHGARLVRRNTIIYGNNLVVAAAAPNRKLAFLYAMWVTDPNVSPQSVGVPGGFADPYRWNHLRDARIAAAYTPEALAAFAAEWPRTRPAGTGVRGDGEYLAALDRQLTAAARGDVTPQQAMRRAAADWEAITTRLGRAAQIREWQAFRRQPGVER